MAIFDDPHRELNRIQEQLLEDEECFQEEEAEYDEEYEEDYGENYDPEPEEESPPRQRSNRGLILLALAELLGIGLIAAYWLRVIL